MNDRVKYHIEKAECALRTALSFSEKESVYVISAISKALIELDNTMFAERIEAAAKEGNTSAQGLISITKESQSNGSVKYEMNNTPFKWDNKTSFVPANK
jgi:hypothetical protein